MNNLSAGWSRGRIRTLLALLLLWPLLGVGLAAAGIANAYLSGGPATVYAILLPLAAIGLGIFVLRHAAEEASGILVGFTILYFVAATVAGLVIGYTVTRPFLELTRFPPAENLSVRAAATFNAPGYRHFGDGRILVDRGGEYVDAGVDADGFYYEHRYVVAPVVAPGWRDGDPITVWVVTGSQETAVTDFATWQGPIQGMVQTRHLDNYGRAIETAVATHTLRPAPDALLLRLYAQGVTELHARLLRTMQIFLAVTALLGWPPLAIATIRKEF